MNIGIDCRTILDPEHGEKAGIGHYTYFLVKHVLQIDKKNHYFLYFDYQYSEPKEFLQAKNVTLRQFPFSRYKRYLPFGYSHILSSAALQRDKLDVFHAPANTIPLYYTGPSVVTIHDLAIYTHPEWFPNGQDFSKKIIVPSTLSRAKRIIAVSQSTKQDIQRLFHISPKIIDVVYEGYAADKRLTKEVKEQVQKQYHLKEKYIFFVGSLEPRKNLPALIKAFDSIVNTNWKKWKDWQLVIAGAKGWKYDDIMQAIKQAKCGSQIRYIGYVSHQEKLALLSGSTLFAFPSLWEGFGLPVLEAMGMGIPVLTSNISALPEVCGDAARLINPKKFGEIRAGLQDLMSDAQLRKELSHQGLMRAKSFSWITTARKTVDIYEKVK